MTNPISLPELRAKAERAKAYRSAMAELKEPLKDSTTEVWSRYATDFIQIYERKPDDTAFTIALSPDVVLRLVAVCEAAEKAARNDVGTKALYNALAGLSGNSSGDGCPCCQGGKGEPCMTCVMAVRSGGKGKKS